MASSDYRKLGMGKRILFYAFILNVFVNCACYCETPDSIQISVSKSQFKIGEPVIVRIDAKFLQPNISKTGKVLNSKEFDGFSLQIKEADSNDVFTIYRILPRRLFLDDESGLQYSESFILFYDYKARKIIFNKPSAYDIKLKGETKCSNILRITIDSSDPDEKALAILTEPNDFAFLMVGLYKNDIAVDHLEQVVKQCDGTILATWSAGRLGLEYFNQFQEQHPSYKTAIEHLKTPEPHLKKVFLYLNKAVTLPDEFSIRAEIIEKLVSIEFIKGNYEKVNLLIDEAAQKYPHSEIGKNSQKVKEEFRRAREKEIQEINKPADGRE